MQRDSYVHNGEPAAASRAVDGNRNPNFLQLSCSHTASSTSVWWTAKIKNASPVNKIYIANREDTASTCCISGDPACCPDRLKNFEIGVTDYDPSSLAPEVTKRNFVLCAKIKLSAGLRLYKITCTITMRGKYLVIYNRVNDYLALCEVEAYYNAAEGKISHIIMNVLIM